MSKYHAEQKLRDWPCPYCPAQSPLRFSKIERLEKHTRESTAESHGLEHDRMKADDGWYEDDFFGGTSDYQPRE